MTCPNQLELGEKKLRESSEADAAAKEVPHAVGVWTLNTFLINGLYTRYILINSIQHIVVALNNY